jgi:enoyl-CoA hydratase
VILQASIAPFRVAACTTQHFNLEHDTAFDLLTLRSEDGTNRLTRELVLLLTNVVRLLVREKRPLIISGNHEFFSAGADLSEIAALDGPSAYQFSLMGQALMNEISEFPAPVCAAISGYCMGGGLDLALACRYRIASPHSVFGHRGAALGLITGWGGTQRLPRLIGKARALQMFVAAEKVSAHEALKIGLVDAIAEDPVAAARLLLRDKAQTSCL